MKRCVLVLTLLIGWWCRPLHAGAAKKYLTPEIINTEGALVEPGIARVEWRPGADEISYIRRKGSRADDGKELDLYDVPSGKESGLLDSSTLGEEVSLDSYVWSPKGDELLFRGGSDLWLYDLATQRLRRLTDDREPKQSPTFSPTGEWIAFVKQNDLYVLQLKTGMLERLTYSGSSSLFNGKLDWVYEEELADRATSPAYVWSQDGREIAYLQLDDSPVPIYPITHFLSDHITQTSERFPQAGDPNPKPALHVVAVGNSEAQDRAYPLKDASAEYIAPSFDWTPDSSTVCFLTLNRDQTEMELHAWQPATDRDSVLLTEHDPYWINAHVAPVFVDGGKKFLWLSERDGWMHLYLYRADGTFVGKLTKGDWMIDHPLFSNVPMFQVDEKNGRVYFTSTDPDPRERQVWGVRLDGGGLERLTREPGMHSFALDPEGEYFVDTFSGYQTPPRTRVLKSDGSLIATIDTPKDHLDEYALGTTDLVDVKAADGATLDARLVKPPDFNPHKKYPVIIDVYGGPEIQTVVNRWGVTSYLDQLFSEHGFLVWQLDNRGSWGRGHAWESVIFEHMGERELQDQLAGVDYLKSLPYVDPDRLGVWGWSYGGYMTLFMLTHAPDVFKCGAAGGPVAAWKYYDSIYTERYMRTPQQNPEGYQNSSPLFASARLKANLLLIHGVDDDNVHLQNTMNFIQALVENGKPFELYLQPGQKHGFAGQTVRTFLDQRVLEFFERNLAAR